MHDLALSHPESLLPTPDLAKRWWEISGLYKKVSTFRLLDTSTSTHRETKAGFSQTRRETIKARETGEMKVGVEVQRGGLTLRTMA